MDLQEIAEKINLLLSGESGSSFFDGRKIVFWYDEDAEYMDEIDSIALAEDYKIWRVTENNWFETKLQIEVRDKETSYLLYGCTNKSLVIFSVIHSKADHRDGVIEQFWDSSIAA